jgi:hypothetical protein
MKGSMQANHLHETESRGPEIFQYCMHVLQLTREFLGIGLGVYEVGEPVRIWPIF